MGDNEQDGKTLLRLITVFHRDAGEPWYLVTNTEDMEAKKVTRTYEKRWWTESMFRDLKNRKWGLGMDEVKLTTAERMATHIIDIYHAKESDFQKATQRVFRSAEMPSKINVLVLP